MQGAPNRISADAGMQTGRTRRARRGTGPGTSFRRTASIILLAAAVATVWPTPARAGHSPGHERGGPGGGGPCDKSLDLTSQIHNARVVGLFDSGICSNADLDLFVTDGYGAGERLYAVVAGGEEAAFTLIDVTDPTAPELVIQQFWPTTGPTRTVTSHVQAFSRGGQPWLALGTSRASRQGFCGVWFLGPTLVAPKQLTGDGGSENDAWCDVNDLFIESVAGEGAFLYVAASETFDLRVFDIRADGEFITPVEVGRYRRSDIVLGSDGNGNSRGKNDPDGSFDDNLVSGVFVADRVVPHGGGPETQIPTVYVSYMRAGLDILPASLVRDAASETPTPVPFAHQDSVNDDGGVTSLEPAPHLSGAPFVVHDAVPDATGRRVFLLDELSYASEDSPVQAWDLENGPAFLDGLTADADVPASPPHALTLGVAAGLGETTLPAGSLDDRLSVGWYRLGLQAWDFDGSHFVRGAPPNGGPRTAEVFHQARTDARDDTYDGAWAVKVARIDDAFYGFVSDREFGLIVTCLGDGQGNVDSVCPPALEAQP